MFAALLAGLFCLHSLPLFSLPIPWRAPKSPVRKVVVRGPDDFFLIQLPTVVDTWKVVSAAAFAESATNRLPVRVVWRDKDTLSLLIDGSGLKHSERVHVYPCPADDGQAPVAKDPLPLRGRAARTAGMDLPSTWEQVVSLQTRYDTAPRPLSAASFEELPATFKSWYRGDWTRKNYLVELHTWLLVPPGKGNTGAGDVAPPGVQLAFGMAGTSPAWLFIDGSNILVHPPGQPYERWTSSAPIPFKAGLREVKVVTALREKIDTGLAWKRPGATNIASDVRMITGGTIRDGRWERRGVRPSLFARAEEGRTYRFAEKPDTVFVPYTFIDRSYGVSTNVSHWWIDGRPVGTGRKFATVLAGTNIHTAQLANAGATFDLPPLAWSGRLWREEHVSVSVRGVPAFCFDDVSVAPILSVRTTAPDDTPFTLRVTSFPPGNGVDPVVRDYPVTPNGGKGAVYLPPFEVSTVERISWTLVHEGVALKTGQLLFPVSTGSPRAYGIFPDTFSGETLLAAGDYLCYLVPRASAWRFGVPSAPQPNRPAALFVSEGRSWGTLADTFPHRLAPPEDTPDCGNPELALFAALASVTGTVSTASEEERSTSAETQRHSGENDGDVSPSITGDTVLSTGVVYAPVVRMADLADLDAFECRVSAMLGLLAAPAFGNVTVLVPPVPDTLPDCGCVPAKGGRPPCPHAARIREAAERVLRAADTRNVWTFDLYTLFQTTDSGSTFFTHGCLTPDGATLINKNR
ncbi:MAG: hypothetical protein J6Z49_07330 [Kiritimatiellae bacterium]|nr:hypothetical protein [Kiritimatiellia bacterium]